MSAPLTSNPRCGGSGMVYETSGGSGWGTGGPEAIVEHVECPGCADCEAFQTLIGALQEVSAALGSQVHGTVVRAAIEELQRQRAIVQRISEARERDDWNEIDDAVDDLLRVPHG